MMVLILIFVLWSISVVIDSYTAFETKAELKRVADATERNVKITDTEAMEYAEYVVKAVKNNQVPLSYTAWSLQLK